MSIALPNRGGSDQANRPWLDLYPSSVPSTLQYPDEPIWWLLARAATAFPERTAIRYYRQQLSYAQLWTEARRAAEMFIRLGVEPGDRVGLLLPNTPEYLIASYGVWMAGGVVVSINPLSAANEVASLIDATRCRLVVALDLLKPLLFKGEFASGGPSRILTTTICDRIERWKRPGYCFVRWQRHGLQTRAMAVCSLFAEELAAAPPCRDPLPRSADEAAYILPTGGTTAAPKAVVLTHGNLVANAWQLMHWTGQSFGQDSMLAVVPFFHSYGLSTCATAGVASAATMTLFHRFKAATVADLIQRHRPTCFPAVPMMLHQLNQEFRKRRSSKQQLVEYCVSGGAPLTADVATEFAEHTGALVVEGYGLSEASPVTHVCPLDESARLGSIGLPLPDTDARIVDRNTGTTILPQGEVGELIIQGPQVMSGYFEDSAATRRALRGGWLYTGDLARQNRDGSFQIVDRKKDLIITSGSNVYPAEVEEVLCACPGVLEAAVVGIDDPRRGEAVKAVLKVSKIFRRRTFDGFIEQNLAKYKRPRIVEFIEGDLPRNFLGKVVRRDLR